jgi:uncharacterized Zn finger protein
VTLEDLEAVATPEIIARAREYWDNGHVGEMVVFNQSCSARVFGLSREYSVKLFWNKMGLNGTCDCTPLNGCCKHQAAVAWGWLNEPGRFLRFEAIESELAALNTDKMRQLLIQLANQDPRLVAGALGLRLDEPRLRTRALIRMAAEINKYNLTKSDWFKSWRNVLSIAEDHSNATEPLLEVFSRLIEFAFKHLKNDSEPDQEFWDLFQMTLIGWGKYTGSEMGELPAWWKAGYITIKELCFSSRQRVVEIITSNIGKPWGEQLLISLGFPPQNDNDDFIDCLDLSVRLALFLEKDFGTIVEWAMVELNRLLVLLDALCDAEVWDMVIRIARTGLRLFPTEDHHMFRRRIAKGHRGLKEPRQALSLLVKNFRERPDWYGYLELVETAREAGEDGRAFRVAKETLAQNGSRELWVRICLLENAIEELIEAVPYLSRDSVYLQEAALKIRRSEPQLTRDLYMRRIRYLIHLGTRKAVKEAIPLTKTLKKLCREEGWNKQWESFRQRIAAAIYDPISLRMMGSLLEK